MGKVAETQIMGKYCEDCKYCTIDESNKAWIKVHCGARNKTYHYGQCIPCDDKEKKGKRV